MAVLRGLRALRDNPLIRKGLLAENGLSVLCSARERGSCSRPSGEPLSFARERLAGSRLTGTPRDPSRGLRLKSVRSEGFPLGASIRACSLRLERSERPCSGSPREAPRGRCSRMSTSTHWPEIRDERSLTAEVDQEDLHLFPRRERDRPLGRDAGSASSAWSSARHAGFLTGSLLADRAVKWFHGHFCPLVFARRRNSEAAASDDRAAGRR